MIAVLGSINMDLVLRMPRFPQPGETLTGTELAYFYNAIGTEVTLVEFLPAIVPLEDKDVSSQLGRSLKTMS